MNIYSTIRILVFIGVTAIAQAVPDVASAYIGPGAGITALGTVLTLFLALFLMIAGFVWYPVKRLLARLRNGQNPQ